METSIFETQTKNTVLKIITKQGIEIWNVGFQNLLFDAKPENYAKVICERINVEYTLD